MKKYHNEKDFMHEGIFKIPHEVLEAAEKYTTPKMYPEKQEMRIITNYGTKRYPI